MLVDGIYSVRFETLAGQGDGVVVISGDSLRGGDASFVYYGTIQHSENGFIAQIETRRHSQGRPSVFNMESVHIHLIGKSDGLDAICTGTALEVPGLIFKAILKFVHE
jgi:T3SS negative regulator,GrlR